ncbi:histidine phosphatase family protein [Dermatophilaceae bacterium Sec6.4]
MTTDRHRLVLIRHAKAQEPGAVPDHERELAPSGRADAAALGRWFKEHNVQVQETCCSTAARTRQTWAGVVDASGIGAIVEHDRRIYNAEPQELLAVLRGIEDKVETLAVVGHAPGVPLLAAELAGDDSDAEALASLAASYPTCTVAVLEFDGAWSDLAAGSATLLAVHTARAD